MEKRYPTGTVTALLNTDFVSPMTKHALEQRIAKAKTTKPLFFTASDFEILSIICDRLVAQDSNNRIVNIAIFIDERLNDNSCDGWRYNEMPPDRDMFLKGISGIDELALSLFSFSFIKLQTQQQLEVLHSLQSGTAESPIWKHMSPKLFFEELLAETTEIFYSFPLVQQEIGYVGMADEKGWSNIGLNQNDEIEPMEIKTPQEL